jgi:Flp pilus assembly protein TadG
MIVSTPRRSRRHGVAAVEFAVMMLFFIPFVLLGLFEIGRVVMVQNIIDNAARDGGRMAASGSFYSSNNNAAQPTVYNGFNASALLDLAAPSKGPGSPPAGGYFETQIHVINYLTAANLSVSGTTVTVTNTTQGWSYSYTGGGSGSGGGFDPAACAKQKDSANGINTTDQLQVTVAMTYASISWSPTNFYMSPGASLSAVSTWYTNRNIPVLLSTTPLAAPLPPGAPIP